MSGHNRTKGEDVPGGCTDQTCCQHLEQANDEQADTACVATDTRGCSEFTFRSTNRGAHSANSYWPKLTALAEQMAPCAASVWLAAACAVVPLESVRYKRSKRVSTVRLWLTQSKVYAIRDGMLVQIADRKTSRPMGKGAELWLRLKTAERLTEEEALTAWTRSTWKNYKCELVAMQWAKRLPDGSLAWTGPADATFTDFQQYRMRFRNK